MGKGGETEKLAIQFCSFRFHFAFASGKFYSIFKRHEGYFLFSNLTFFFLFSFIFLNSAIQTIERNEEHFKLILHLCKKWEITRCVRESHLGTGETLLLLKIYNQSLSIKLCNCVGWTVLLIFVNVGTCVHANLWILYNSRSAQRAFISERVQPCARNTRSYQSFV